MENNLIEKLNTITGGIEDIKKDISKIGSDIIINKTNISCGFAEAKKERSEIKKRIDDTYDSVDGFVKIVSKLEDEFTALKQDLSKVK